MKQVIAHAASLLDDMGNAEYVRGMCELLARMYPESDVCTDDRAEYFRSEIAAQVAANNR